MKHLRSIIPSTLFPALVVLILSQTTKATSAIMVSDTDLIVNSRVIVSGTVSSVTSDWDPAGGMIWTYVEIRTNGVFKGGLQNQTIVLKQMGGEVNGYGVRVVGQPTFSPGEVVLMFLNSGSDGSLHPAHSFMGKFVVSLDRDGVAMVERAVNTDDVELFGRTNGEVTNRANLDTYLTLIRRTLRREAAQAAAAEAAFSNRPIVAIPPEFLRKQKESGLVSPQFTYFNGPVRWMEADSGQPVRYFVNPSSSPVPGGASAEIARAMSAWPSQSGASIQLQVAGQTSNCGIVIDNTNTISFGDCLNQLDPPIGCAGIVGLTAVSWIPETRVVGGTSFSRLLEADTVFNNGMDCFLSVSSNLAEVICHELGHSLGLGHSADLQAVMWATAHGHGRDATLSNDDKNGILSIYPSSGGVTPGPIGSNVSITTLSLLDGAIGLRYTTTLQATGGTPPYRWLLVGGNLPSGLSLASNGTIDGIPNFSGTSNFVAQVIDSASSPRTDSRLFSLNIRSGGGSAIVPAISGIKVKGVKKLWVFGQNFRADSLVLINGVVFQPVYFGQEGPTMELLAKGRLNLGPSGTNTVVVINSDNRSAQFPF